MYEFILVIHVILAVLLIGLILLQQGKGAGMGTAFGGATEAMLTSPAAGNVLSRATALIATAFFITSLTLSYLAAQRSKQAQQDVLPVAPAVIEPEAQIEEVPVQPEVNLP